MRHELVLLGLILILLVGETLFAPAMRKRWSQWAIGLFTVHTAIGFLPLASSELFGGMFVTNDLTHFFKSVLNLGVLIVLLQTSNWVQSQYAEEKRGGEFYILLFSSLLGLFYMISAGELTMFYLGLELSTLPVAVLVAYDLQKRAANEGAIKLILSAALASGTALFGMSLIYAATGSLHFDGIQAALGSNALTILGTILFLAGLAFKISLVPFHFWTADVYEGAPIGIAAFLSVISKGSAAFVLTVLLFQVFASMSAITEPLLITLALTTMFIGNLFALRQKNIKRFLAFSSVAQAGFILLGMLDQSALGAATVVYFVAIYVFSNLAAFGVAQAISERYDAEDMSSYEGLYRTNPKLSLVMMLALFSLAGIPPVAGFFAKFFLFTAAASQGHYLLVFLAVVNVTISLYYYLLWVRAIFLRKNENALPHFNSSWSMRLGLILPVIGILVLGVYSPFFEYILELTAIFN